MTDVDHRQGGDASVPDALPDNIVLLSSEAIQNIVYIKGSLVFSDGMPHDLEPEIPKPTEGGTWKLNMPGARVKTRPVAQSFKNICGGEDHLYKLEKIGDRSPEELNFYFGVVVTFLIGDETFNTNIYLGQGSWLLANNWWIGGGAIAAPDGKSAVLPLISPSGLTAQVFELGWHTDSGFALNAWF
ncbi:hypothetical protein [Bosea vaviloviae]|uniref:Uncharacterized protein n=1 Tax=Bosea vaviloviae TaxID=1526658 RepID=A0A1D7U804_9HYPH|nr:hypothetical protein [Bosea vaviloviae]AOO83464.1 hypothetical protein BHK69_26175 [Bosea vaviloviae]